MSETRLNSEQLSAVNHGSGPLLIIAGAGTGKTTVVTERIKYLIQKKDILPSEILALTFTEKAANEMEERVDLALPYGYTQMWIETFHAFCDRVLRHEAIHIGLNPSFSLMTEADTLLFLKKNLFKFELSYFRPLGNPMKFLSAMITHFSRLRDDDITPQEYLNYAKKLIHSTQTPEINKDEIKKTLELATAYKTYEELKAESGMMDFSDLISNTLKLFRTRENILKDYQKMFKYILVDEFQDTNYAQNELAILLAGQDKNITVVGDDDQSIYRWRGAAISNMIQFKKHFPKSKIISLTKNYRSTQKILDGAYQLIQNNNPDRLEVKEKIDKKLTSMRETKGEEIELVYTNKVEDEAEEVALRIIEEKKKKPALNYNDFAILVRANDHALPFQKAMERKKIPYQFLGPGRLFQQNEIKDLIAYLNVLSNFEDTSSLYRVMTLPIFGIAARDVAATMNHAKKNNQSLFEAMENIDASNLTTEGKEKINRLIKMIKRHLEKVPLETAGQILYYFFDDSGLLGHYLDPKTPRTEKEAQNIAKFFEKLQNFATNREDASVFAIVDWIDLSMQLGESPLAADIDWSQNNAVNILTVHSSKGLEFPVVFVVNLVTQRFPGRDRREPIPVPEDLIRELLPTGDENIQEERRLFYVASTRAKDKLFLTASKFYGEAKRPRKISPFVVEALGEEILNIINKHDEQPIGEQLTLLDLANAQSQIIDTNKSQNKDQGTKNQISYISYSQLHTFQMCPLHYKLRYILNFPSPPIAALSYGISVHSALRDLVLLDKKGEKISTSVIKNLLEKNWIKEGYTGKIHEKQTFEQAQKMLDNFYTDYKKSNPDTLAIELPFNFWLNKEIKIGGKIDRIDKLSDKKIEIIDYKTGPNIPDEKKLKNDFQLSFYALAATEINDPILHKNPDDVKLTLYYLETGQKLSTTRSSEELNETKKKILSLVDEIKISEFKCNGGRFCKNCEYKMLCNTVS